MRAMILAAGLGTRLRPMTGVVPKPMLPVANLPQLYYQLELLKAAGIREVVINLHHLAEVIPRDLGDGARLGMRITYSREPEILGTGGGIKACAAFLTADGAPFVVINGDVLIDFALPDALETHRRTGAVATMVLREDPRADRFGALGVDASNRIIDFVGRARAPGEVCRQGLFTGIHVMEPEVLSFIPEGPCGINETAYPAMIREGRRVQAHFQRGYWSDVGTPSRYLEANVAVLGRALKRLGLDPFQEAAWAQEASGQCHGNPDSVRCARDAVVVPPVVFGDRAVIGPGARIGPFVALGAGAEVGQGARVSHAVLWAGTRVAPGAHVERVVLWRRRGRTETLWVDSSGA